MRFRSDKAEQMRLRALYKRLALEGRLKGLSIEALRSIVGPDCAYHLYWAAGDAVKPACEDGSCCDSGAAKRL